jgi:hypothetical protein
MLKLIAYIHIDQLQYMKVGNEISFCKDPQWYYSKQYTTSLLRLSNFREDRRLFGTTIRHSF